MGVYIIIAFVIAYCGRNIAERKERSAVGWFLLCLFFPPAILLLLTLGKNPDKQEARMLEEKRQFEMEHKKCPYCAEYIKREAKVCKHCGRDVPVLDIVLEQPKQEKIAEHSETEKSVEHVLFGCRQNKNDVGKSDLKP